MRMSSPTSGGRRAPRRASRFTAALAASLVVAIAGLPLPSHAQGWDVGLGQTGSLIRALGSANPSAGTPTVVLVGGMDGDPASAAEVTRAFEAHEAGEFGRNFDLVAIPMANPDRSTLMCPPTGVAYREHSESHALWRWLGVHAPDLVLVVGADDHGLAAALSDQPVADVGAIPARNISNATPATIEAAASGMTRSEAATEVLRRRARTPEQLADELAGTYGHDFDQLTYLPGMALIARMRMGAVADVGGLAAPYLNTPPDIRSSLNIAGHLVFAELAERTGESGYLDLVRRAADLAFDETGAMREAMPLHGEMRDAFFMSGPLLARAGRLTGERRYFDMAARHVAFMNTLVLRPDGLYRHSPLAEAAWSRGNAFPALGMALMLSAFPADHPAFAELVAGFRQHLTTLSSFQDADGMWHEVVDHAGSYAEFSSTAMIGTAMLIGIRAGWLDASEYAPRVTRAWVGVLARTGSDGTFVDVCESTNKQDSLEAYLNRMAILGPDPRAGGMVLMFATEMAGLE